MIWISWINGNSDDFFVGKKDQQKSQDQKTWFELNQEEYVGHDLIGSIFESQV